MKSSRRAVLKMSDASSVGTIGRSISAVEDGCNNDGFESDFGGVIGTGAESFVVDASQPDAGSIAGSVGMLPPMASSESGMASLRLRMNDVGGPKRGASAKSVKSMAASSSSGCESSSATGIFGTDADGRMPITGPLTPTSSANNIASSSSISTISRISSGDVAGLTNAARPASSLGVGVTCNQSSVRSHSGISEPSCDFGSRLSSGG